MALEEIEKLRQRVEKDPNSRLFLPLAEEYRKSGMLDEAITVLLNGLKHHGGYASARVALGRIYLEKSMLKEARVEFEGVVQSVPDNLFAHRKLADIYKELGETEKAVAEYRTVLTLNPLDEDARGGLETLAATPQGGLTAAGPPERETAATLEVPPETPASEETAEGFAEEAILAGDLSDGEVTAISKSPDFETEFEEFSRSLSQQMDEEPQTADSSFFVIEPDEFPEGLSSEGGVPGLPAPGESEDTAVRTAIERADSLIGSGEYPEAINVYRSMLARYPDSRDLLQRVAELKAYLKLIGKSEELMIARLEAFREGMKRRFNAAAE